MHNSQPQPEASQSEFREFRCLHKRSQAEGGKSHRGAAETQACGAAETQVCGAEALDKAEVVSMEGNLDPT